MILIRLFTDSESTLKSVASSKQIVKKTLRPFIMDLKEILLSGEITSIAWLPTKDMWADLQTKETKLPKALEDIFTKNDMKMENASISEVKVHAHKVRMSNIRNRKEMHKI